MDSSVASVDLGDLVPTKSNLSSASKEEKSQKSDLSTSKTEFDAPKVEPSYSVLDASDVVEYPVSRGNIASDGTKIGENIKSINNLTSKINEFVTDKSKNIKYQIEGFKRKVSNLEEQVQGERIAKEKLEGQL